MDDALPFILNILLANIASLLGIIAVLCSVQPLLLLLLVVLAYSYRHVDVWWLW